MASDAGFQTQTDASPRGFAQLVAPGQCHSLEPWRHDEHKKRRVARVRQHGSGNALVTMQVVSKPLDEGSPICNEVLDELAFERVLDWQPLRRDRHQRYLDDRRNAGVAHAEGPSAGRA